MLKVRTLVFGFIIVLILTACGSTDTSKSDAALKDDKIASLENELSDKQTKISKLENEARELGAQHQKLKSEYSAYKKKMEKYETLAEDELQLKQEQARSELAAIESEKRAQEEAEQEAKRAAEEERRKEAEEKEKQGYETGISYEQLARTPDDFLTEKVKFYGRVLQVIEGSSEVQLRLAVDGDYDEVIYLGYSPSIVSQRVLEDDYITIYGTSIGTITYKSTLGGDITIPAVAVDKIEFD